MPTVVNKDKTGGLLCSEHPKASVGIKPLDLNLKANRVRMNTRKLIYIEVLKRGDRQTVQKNTRVMFECPATASGFLLTSFCHLMQSDHGVRRFLVTVKKRKKRNTKHWQEWLLYLHLHEAMHQRTINIFWHVRHHELGLDTNRQGTSQSKDLTG